MRQLSLTVLMLLMSAQAGAADHYHVRRPSYACVDPRAALALNDPAWRPAGQRAATRRQGRCLRIHPAQSWEQVSQPTRFLRLLRRTPPHPGEPPLYFRDSALEVSRRDPPVRARGRHAAQAVAAVTTASTSEVPAAQAHPSVPMQPVPPAVLPARLSAFLPPSAKAIERPAIVRPAVKPQRLPDGFLWNWSMPLLLWALVIAMAALMVRLVLRWQRNRRDALVQPFEIEMDPGEYRSLCVAGLRIAGWEASSLIPAELGGPDVIASHNGRRLAVQCHLSSETLDSGDVEDACLARDWQGSDLAAIVSNAAFTEPARQLAARNGVVLLHEDQLASFAA